MSNKTYQAWEDEQEIPLSETTKFIVDNRGRTAPTSESGIPLIATNCINNNQLYPTYDKVRFVSRDTYENWFRSHPEPGDIILTLKGSQNGAVCLVPNPVDFVIAQDMVALRADESIIDPLFLFAALRSPNIQYQIKALDVSGVIPHFKKSDFDKLLLPYPDRKRQEFIGKFYFTLSKKIDLLHRQNKTLEALAQTLFRHWFMDGAEDEWEERAITDLFEIRDGTHDSPKQQSVGKTLITSKHIKNFSLDFENAYLISYEDFAKVSKRSNVETFDILFSMIGTVGLTYLEQSKIVDYAIKNVGILKTSQNPNWAYYTYLWLNSSLGQEFIFQHKSGSTQEYISLGSLRSIAFVKPPDHILEKFNAIASPLFRKIQINQEQICTLEKLRDALLPKLMSGEVRVRL